MALTPERKVEIEREVDEIIIRCRRERLVKPKVVTADGRAVRDANVVVSTADLNAVNANSEGVVAVRRADWVTINLAEAERQWEEREAQRKADASRYDPLGLWGPNDVA